MNIPYSKKELYRDNIKMRKELENLQARNIELTIMIEDCNKIIDETNEKIKKHNNK